MRGENLVQENPYSLRLFIRVVQIFVLVEGKKETWGISDREGIIQPPLY